MADQTASIADPGNSGSGETGTIDPARLQAMRAKAEASRYDLIYVMWWIGTSIFCSWIYIRCPDWFGTILSPLSAFAIVASFLFCYAIGLLIDRLAGGKFALGSAPFSSPSGLVFWRGFALASAVSAAELVPVFLDAGKKTTYFTAIIITSIAVVCWLLVVWVLGVLFDVSTACRFSRGRFPFHFRWLRNWLSKVAGSPD